MPRATGFDADGISMDPSIYFLANGSATHFYQHEGPSATASVLANTSAALVSQRLTQLINTYLLLSQTLADVDGREIFTFEEDGGYVVTGPATSTRLLEVYTVAWVWAGLFLAGSVVLLAAGLGSIVFARLALTPDIVGCASSLIRDSRYVQLPAGAAALDGLKLSRALKGESVQYGVVGHLVGLEGGGGATDGGARGFVEGVRGVGEEGWKVLVTSCLHPCKLDLVEAWSLV